MNILVTLDRNYLHQLTVMLKSVECSNPSTYFTVYVVHTKLLPDDFTMLESLFPSMDFISVVPQDSIFLDAHYTKRITRETYVKFIPAEPLEICSGYVWGTFKGMWLCMLGTEIGSLFILAITSLFGEKVLSLLFDINKINDWKFINDSKRKYLLLTVVYLIPGTPKDFITYFVGVTNTSILPFLVLTGIARIPSIISSTWCGEILDTSGVSRFVLIFALITVVSLALGYFANKKIKAIH